MAKKKPTTTVDVLSHFLVPKMEILSENEKKRLFQQYSIDESKLPKVNSDDAAAVALKAQVGDVIKIHQEDVTGKHLSYRLVVK